MRWRGTAWLDRCNHTRGEFTTRDMAWVGLLVGGMSALLIIPGGGLVMRWWGLLR